MVMLGYLKSTSWLRGSGSVATAGVRALGRIRVPSVWFPLASVLILRVAVRSGTGHHARGLEVFLVLAHVVQGSGETRFRPRLVGLIPRG
jgi:hypothetical protein